MTVGEVVDILSLVERERLVYVPDKDGKAELVAAIVDLRHCDLPIEGISIPDDIALIPLSLVNEEDL